MMELTALMASLLLAAQAQPAPAADTSATDDQTAVETAAATEEAAPEPEVDDDDKIICRRTAVVGSKFKKKICGTKKQWETLSSRGTETTREFQRRGKGLEPVN